MCSSPAPGGRPLAQRRPGHDAQISTRPAAASASTAPSTTSPIANAIEPIVDALDTHRGALLASSYEYPGRYTRWDMGFVDPPLVLCARGRDFRVEALNARGRVLLPRRSRTRSAALDAVERLAARTATRVAGTVRAPAGRFTEEERSRQPSVFSLLRALIALFRHPHEPHLGLYGAFGYDLAFQFEPIRLRLDAASRPARSRALPARTSS